MTTSARTLLADFSGYLAIDVTCHIGQWPYQLGASSDMHALQEYITRHGLSAVWVSHLAALFGFDTRTGNEECLISCRDDPAIHPMAVINPLEETWRSELDWAIDAGFLGIRLAPGFHGYGQEPLVDVARATAPHGLVVQLLVRLDDERVRHPQSPASDVEIETAEALVRSVPEAPLLLSGLNWIEWQALTQALGDQLPPTLCSDFWHVDGPFGVTECLEEAGEHWVFGSGFPIQAPEPTMLQLSASMLANHTQLAIARENAEGLTP